MEDAMLAELCKVCGEKGVTVLRGYYCPTKKNGMVKDLYGRLGFTLIKEDSGGNSEWLLPLSEFVNQNKYITIL